MVFATTLPMEVRSKVRAGVAQHIDLVIAQDWPAIAVARANPRSESVGLTNMAELLAFRPGQPEQQIGLQGALAAIEHAFEAKRNRITLSEVEIASIQWAAIGVLALLICVIIAALHANEPMAMAIALLVFSTAMVACLVLLMENDRPFSAGGITLSPSAFCEIVPN
jgi:hypothetical protein